MTGAIIRVKHRHSDLKRHEADLTLEVGQPLPAFYQEGRRAGRVVMSIEPYGSSYICRLDDGDVIMVGGRVQLTRSTDA